ncbi:AT-rich interactive domain-containing protein 4A-like isoform X3 [Papaver somniferum]|uniref:AT-rich interactive domain-containing protein 4A-like isoform X3 n=1 Tax=Papaver somniferum TaxID=3469 RepID=UPI000E6FD578|nr:AT-rich interactive domain-containing protein 4A-like isoform X3 [Papaver somniferum]
MGIPNPKAGGGGAIVNDSPSSTTKRHQTDPSPLSFSEGERVLAYHDPLIYEAKVITVEIKNPYDNTKEYLIHYKGWNKKWDEWVGVERLLKFTEENKKLQEELKLAQQHIEKNPKSGCLSNMNPESFTDAKMDQEDTRIHVRKGKRQTSDFRVKEELKLEQQDMEKDLKSGCLSNMKSESSADAKMDQDDTRKYAGKGKKRRSDFNVEDEPKLVQLRIEKNPNSGCLSNMIPESSTGGKGKKRTSDFSVEKQRRCDAAYENVKPLGFLNKKVIRTKIDSLLKVYGGDEGWAFIEEASYKLLIECLLECQEQLDLNVEEENNQGILLPKEEEVQETDEQLLRKNSRRKIPRLSLVAGTSMQLLNMNPEEVNLGLRRSRREEK